MALMCIKETHPRGYCANCFASHRDSHLYLVSVKDEEMRLCTKCVNILYNSMGAALKAAEGDENE